MPAPRTLLLIASLLATPSSAEAAAPARGSVLPAEIQISRSARILAIGDSLTAGYNVRASESYPAVLSRQLGIPVTNAGINGETSTALLARLPRELARARYDRVLLCIGGNDLLRGLSLQTLQANLEQAVDVIRATGAEPVLIAVPFPRTSMDLPVYRAVGARKDVAVIGGLGASLMPQHFQGDGLHPNRDGYRQIVDGLMKSIRVQADS